MSKLKRSDVDERLRSARPAPSEDALERALTRAQRTGTGTSRASSLLWSSAPRMRGRMRAIAVAGACSLVAMTAGAAVLNSSGSGGSGSNVVDANAASHQYGHVDNVANPNGNEGIINPPNIYVPIQVPINVCGNGVGVIGVGVGVGSCSSGPAP